MVDELTRRLVDDGKLVEAGWRSLVVMAGKPGGSPAQLAEMRMAFFAGAQHVFGSMMSMLEDGHDATEADLRRMSAIDDELQEFLADFKLRYGDSEGTGLMSGKEGTSRTIIMVVRLPSDLTE